MEAGGAMVDDEIVGRKLEVGRDIEVEDDDGDDDDDDVHAHTVLTRKW